MNKIFSGIGVLTLFSLKSYPWLVGRFDALREQASGTPWQLRSHEVTFASRVDSLLCATNHILDWIYLRFKNGPFLVKFMEKNRNNPEHVQYYQHLADLIRPIWETFYSRFEDGIPSRYLRSLRGDEMNLHRASSNLAYVLFSVKSHAYQFLSEVGFAVSTPFEPFDFFPLPEESAQVARDPFVKRTIESVFRLSPSASKVEGISSLEKVVYRGFNTAFAVLGECIVAKGDVLMLSFLSSKVALHHLGEMTYHIMDAGISHLIPPPETLRFLGVGTAVGCPASLSPSGECRSLLLNYGLRADQTTTHKLIEDSLRWTNL